MKFPVDVYLAAFVSAAILSAASLPWWRRWCVRVGLVDDPGHRKIHAQPIPLAGGLAVMTGVMAPVVLAGIALFLFGFDLPAAEPIRYGYRRRMIQLATVLGGGLAMVALGWWDDKHELRAGWKFSGQLLVASLVAVAGVRVTLFVDSLFFSYAITVLWILTVTNAFNFMDNMNGLSGGVGFIAGWFFAWSAARQGQYLVALLALLVCGALLGFLPFNFPKARAFLGDSGSHLVGFLMAILSILPHFYSTEMPHPWAVIKPLFILAVPLGDLTRVVWVRWREGLPFYVGDTNHLSHRLVRSGWSRTMAVLWLWLASIVCGSISLWP